MKNKFLNLKNKLFTFVKSNKKLCIAFLLILIVIIFAIIIVCSKTEKGNTSGNLNNLGFSVQKGNWVYYLGLKDSNTDGIYKVKANNNEIEKISSDYGLYLNKSGKFLYYLDSTSNNYDIVKMKTNGDNKEIILNDVDATKFTIENDWIYYFKDSNFYRVKTSGESKQILSQRKIDNYEIVDNWIYYSYISDGKYVISKMKTDGTDDTKIDDDSAKQFFVKDSYIYYIYENNSNYELYKVKTNGKNKEKVSDIIQEVHLDTINFNEDRIFYIRTDENNNLGIYSMKLNGKNEIKITDIQGYYTTINIHGKWVYYTDIDEEGDSQMYRIKTNGKDKQSLSV